MDTSLENLKVLIVDDQTESRALLKLMLKEMGVTQIFEAADGRSGMNFMDLADDFIDVVLCDWNMPSMTGVEFLRQIRSAGSRIPFLMITGRGDQGSVMEAKTSGVSGYIRKPFSAVQIEAKLRITMQKIRKAG